MDFVVTNFGRGPRVEARRYGLAHLLALRHLSLVLRHLSLVLAARDLSSVLHSLGAQGGAQLWTGSPIILLLRAQAHHTRHAQQIQRAVYRLVTKAVDHVAALLWEDKLLALQALLDAIFEPHARDTPLRLLGLVASEAGLAVLVTVEEGGRLVLLRCCLSLPNHALNLLLRPG